MTLSTHLNQDENATKIEPGDRDEQRDNIVNDNLDLPKDNSDSDTNQRDVRCNSTSQ